MYDVGSWNEVSLKGDCTRTLPETKIAPESGWLEDDVPFQKAYLQVLCLFREGS